jgi:hypothetical protein
VPDYIPFHPSPALGSAPLAQIEKVALVSYLRLLMDFSYGFNYSLNALFAYFFTHSFVKCFMISSVTYKSRSSHKSTALIKIKGTARGEVVFVKIEFSPDEVELGLIFI